MEQKIEEAVNYARDTQRLEDNVLTENEVQDIIKGINQDDSEFTTEVLEKIKQEREDSENVKIRK